MKSQDDGDYDKLYMDRMKPKPDETYDSIKDIKLFQAKTGYRFSIDALLLEDFICCKSFHRGIEFGAGSGIISLLLAKRNKAIKLTAVELQESLAGRAEKNVKLNKLNGRIDVVNEDINNLKKIFPAGKFDFAFSNPPFRNTGAGRLSMDEERAVARHEIKITLPDIIDTAAYLVKNGGGFFLIYHPFRLVELMVHLQKARLEPKRLRFVHSRTGEEAKMVLIEAVKGSGAWLKIAPPLYIYEKGSEYTAEMKKIYGEG